MGTHLAPSGLKSDSTFSIAQRRTHIVRVKIRRTAVTEHHGIVGFSAQAFCVQMYRLSEQTFLTRLKICIESWFYTITILQIYYIY